MLLVIRLAFLVTGLWAAISGRLPERFFQFLFGKGNYDLDPDYARLYGLMLISPLPITLFVSSGLGILLGARSAGPAIAFEVFYVLTVTVAATVIARRIRIPIDDQLQQVPDEAGRPGNYGTRLLMMTALVVLAFVTIGSIAVFFLTWASTILIGARTMGEFFQDVLPFITLLVLIVLGSVGTYN